MTFRKDERYEQEHQLWLIRHLSARNGERKERLRRGHGHAEREFLRRIWWPAFGHFDSLHPEYEVVDFRGGSRYVDLAYLRAPYRIGIEVDGFGPHVKDVTRRQYCDQWVRQMHLLNDRWIIARIGYDDVVERPRLWQQLFQQMIGCYFSGGGQPSGEADLFEREILRLAVRSGGEIRLADVKLLLSCEYRKARTLLRKLTEKNWLIPARVDNRRHHIWKLNVRHPNLPL